MTIGSGPNTLLAMVRNFLSICSATTIAVAASVALVLNESAGAEHTIRVVTDDENLRMYFDPKFLQIENGDSVTWVNESVSEHKVVTFPDGYPRRGEAFQSPIMTQAGERWTHTFAVDGTYEFFCARHFLSAMHGMIVVKRMSTNDEFNVPSKSEVTAYQSLIHKLARGEGH